MTTPTTDLERTAVIAGDWLPGYELVSVLGAGGFGTVLQARQMRLDRAVAVKVMQLDRLPNPDMAGRFEAEAVTLARLHHPNIVQVYDYGCHDGRLFIAMELLEGEDLGQRLRRAGPLGEHVAWGIARQAASALAHAAAHGVVHRDVKPPNLFLVPAPSGFGLPSDVPLVKVTDFGLARTKWAAPDRRRTGQGVVLGTPLYMAPEQYRSEAGLDHRADIYALGATVFHALAGHPPFDGPTIWDVMVRKLDPTPPPWPNVSRESVELLTAMMAPDANDRIATYEELIDRIERLPASREPASAPPAARPATRPASRPAAPGEAAPKSWRHAAAVVGLIALVAVEVHRARLVRPAAAASPTTAARYVSGGDQEALFDGVSLAHWLPPAAGGSWHKETDDEGAPVLAGTDFTRRTFSHHANYRVILGLDVYQAAAAEVHFAIPAKAPDSARRFVLRVSKAGGAVFGTRDGDRGPFRPLGPPVPFPPASWLEGRRPYLEVRVERTGDVWLVWFNGEPAGREADDGTPKAAEMRLAAEGGPARVDSVVLEKLTVAE